MNLACFAALVVTMCHVVRSNDVTSMITVTVTKTPVKTFYKTFTRVETISSFKTECDYTTLTTCSHKGETNHLADTFLHNAAPLLVQETVDLQEIRSRRQADDFIPANLIESSIDDEYLQYYQSDRTPRLVFSQLLEYLQQFQNRRPSTTTLATITKTVTATTKKPFIQQVFPVLFKSRSSSAQYEVIANTTTRTSSPVTVTVTHTVRLPQSPMLTTSEIDSTQINSKISATNPETNLHESTASLENEMIPFPILTLVPTALWSIVGSSPAYSSSPFKTYTSTTTVTSTRLQPSMVIMPTTTYITTTAVFVSTVGCVQQDYITSPCPEN